MVLESVSLLLALGAGLLSFLSPCVLPLVPTYLSYLAGASLADLGDSDNLEFKRRLWGNALAFVAGFSLVFIFLGLSASALGQLLLTHKGLLRQVSGVLIILFGLHLTGLLRWSWLQRERRVHFIPRQATPLNSVLMGMAFSAGWTPCIGPTLGSILMLSSNSATIWQGGALLAVYSAGLAIPFLTVTMAVKPAVRLLRRWSRWIPVITVLSGVLMVIIGVMVYTNYFVRLSGLFYWGI